MKDEEIIGLYFDRDERAITESDLKYGRYVFTVAQNILKSREDSEECVNDTWLRSWNTIPPKRPSFLRMFFAEITRNLAFDRYRREHAKKRSDGELPLVLDELEECISDRRSVEDEIIGEELSDCISKFVRNLPERDGNLFLRRYFFTESVQDIAKMYGMKPNNVTVILKRVREKLRKHLVKEGYLNE